MYNVKSNGKIMTVLSNTHHEACTVREDTYPRILNPVRSIYYHVWPPARPTVRHSIPRSFFG